MYRCAANVTTFDKFRFGRFRFLQIFSVWVTWHASDNFAPVHY
jgi:hypothetical protein